MGSLRTGVRKDYEAVSLPIWLELLAGFEMLYLRVSPVYWGYAFPRETAPPWWWSPASC
jgi:hypothetical protein